MPFPSEKRVPRILQFNRDSVTHAPVEKWAHQAHGSPSGTRVHTKGAVSLFRPAALEEDSSSPTSPTRAPAAAQNSSSRAADALEEKSSARPAPSRTAFAAMETKSSVSLPVVSSA